MAQKAEDFNLPLSAISKIVKEAIPEGVQVTDVAKVALSKAASVFILYSTSSANNFSHAANRKRILGRDVFDALKDMKLEFLNHPLHNALTAYKNTMETKKQKKENKRASTAKEEEPEEESMEVEASTEQELDVITLDSDSGSGSESVQEESGASSSED
ncbi:DNA polymerase epsilon subunit 3 [Parasteatoda tepidariorum]|uniref:DNA polymerase epsilon subunit 3 n=1 Tax=Parasteatoda tepidariorum TaxID=114398 RepID=UPI00077F97B1|nr:DNA polymerase epsilon subunit 3 [Parasteatoda tepidariorum]